VELTDVVEELYAGDVATFTETRNAFAAKARKDGEKELAASIAKLAKPSRSAHAVNLLVRRDPAVGQDLTELGEELREAEQRRDAGRMRELARRRRQVVDGLADQAFDLIGVDEPAAGLREEVTATLTAALADPDVAAQILAGSLVRAVRWEGFGSVPLDRIGALPEVPKPAARTRSAASKPTRPSPELTGGAGAEAATRLAAERARQQQRDAAVAEARSAADDARRELGRATSQVDGLEARIRDLEVELAEAQTQVVRARTEVRRARTAEREATRALQKLEAGS
jgi:hypothetical protein